MAMTVPAVLSRQLRREPVLRAGSLVVLLAVELAVFASLSPSFLTGSNISNIATQDTENGILALGMAIVIASGGIDLSVGAILALSSIMIGYMVGHGAPMLVAVIVCLLTGLGC